MSSAENIEGSSNQKGGNKWPDLRIASTFWTLMGSQSSLPERESSPTSLSVDQGRASDAAAATVQREKKKKKKSKKHGDDAQRNPTDDKNDSRAIKRAAKAKMASSKKAGRAKDSVPVQEDYRDDDVSVSDADDGSQGIDAADVDFGPLQVFDSNAYSSQPATSALGIGSSAPTAFMGEDQPAEPSSRSKRDKTRKKKHHADETESGGKKKDKKSRRKSSSKESDADRAQLAADLTPHQRRGSSAAVEGSEDVVVPSTQTKKKRKASDSGEGKKRKRRRSIDHGSREEEEVVQSTQDDVNAAIGSERPTSRDAEAATFLRRSDDRTSRPEKTLYEEGVAETGPQTSPSAARLRRRSQSREARSREGSAQPQPAAEPMDVDNATNANNMDAYALQSQESVENLAREAWNEHMNGTANAAAAAEMSQRAPVAQMGGESYPPPPDGGGVGDATLRSHEQAQEPASASSRRRSTRAKKAKPTFFDQQQLGESPYAKALPSPSAMTPQPRGRKKAATRKPKAPKLSQGMHGASDDEGEGTQRGRPRKPATDFIQGRFSDEELDAMRSAIESFREANGLSEYDVNEMVQAPGGTSAGDAHAQLWVRIFAEFPKRHRQKIINVARKNFHNFVARGTWTTEQEAELNDLIGIHGTKWSKIASLINRHPEDLRDRYRNYLVCGTSQRKDAWSEEEEGRLTQLVIEAMEAIDGLRQSEGDANQDLMEKSYEELIDWQDISERMGRTRSRLQCITKWKALNIKTHGSDKLASSQPDSQISFGLEKARRQILAMPEEERVRLVMAIKGSAAATEAKIPWQKMFDKQFRNQWHRSTQALLWYRLKRTVPGWETLAVRDCAQYLHDQYNQTGELPDVSQGEFDDGEEMALLVKLHQPARKSEGAAAPKQKQSGLSEEYVANSGDEEEPNGDAAAAAAAGHEAATNGDATAGGSDDLQIDPALMAAEPPSAQPTGKQRKTPRSKKGQSKKSKKATPQETDPIQDDTNAQATAAAAAAAAGSAVVDYQQQQQHESDIDESQLRKKTPSKFRKPGVQASPRSEHSDSVMDDMEDLPARVASAQAGAA